MSSTQEIAERWGINSQTSSSTSASSSNTPQVPQPILGPNPANVQNLQNSVSNRGSTNYQSRLSRLRSLTLARPPRVRSGSGSAQASADITNWLSGSRTERVRNRFESNENEPQNNIIEDNLIDTTPETPEES